MNEGAPTNEERTLMHEEIPSTPEGLHSYIVEELGDTELARRVAARPDLTAQYIEGEGLPGIPFFKMTQEIGGIDRKLGMSLLGVAAENDRLLESIFRRVIGGGFTDAEKEEYLLYKRLEVTQNAVTPYANEREKTPWELEAISYADKKLDELRNSFGLESFPIIQEQVHTIETPQLENGNIGKADIFKGEARLAESAMTIDRLNLITHELLHLKSYSAAEVEQEETGEIGVRSYRLGLNVRDRKTDAVYLNGLNEAITEELTNKIVWSIPDDHPVFGEMLRAHKDRVATMVEEHPEDFDEYHRPDWIVGFGKKDDHEKVLTGYIKERQVMYKLFNSLYAANPERFAGKNKEEAEEEMFQMLAKGAFTGNILPFGRLFNETFGRGKFREFAHLQTNKEQEDFLRSL